MTDCEQHCVDDGGLRCACKDGYVLGPGGKECLGQILNANI